MQATIVRVRISMPTGLPVPGAAVQARLAGVGVSPSDGLIDRSLVDAVTDANGEASLELWPSTEGTTGAQYRITARNQDGSKLLDELVSVPISAAPVWLQDIVLLPPPSPMAYDEAAIIAITENKVAALAASDAAAASAVAAANSEAIATTKATNALASQQAAASSAANAAASAAASLASQNGAATSANDAAASAASAAAQAVGAQNSANDAAATLTAVQAVQGEVDASAAAAATSAANAETSEANAADSAAATLVLKNSASLSETNASSSATAAQASQSAAAASAADAQDAATRAETAAATVTGSLVERGGIDLSGGVYPAAPSSPSFWKVTAGGTIASDGEVYGVGDTLVYSTSIGAFYKIDNTESVTSVAGQSGVVTLDKTDVGLGAVDNTADVDKPVSTAQQAALNAKQDKADNLTALAGLTGAADKLPYFTGAGALSLGALTSKARDLLAAGDTTAMQGALGLGNAALRNVMAGLGDTSVANALMPLGAMGLGGNAIEVTAGSILADRPTGFYAFTNATTDGPVAGVSYRGFVLRRFLAGNPAAELTITLWPNTSSNICYTNTRDYQGNWMGWKTQLNKGDYGLGGTAITVTDPDSLTVSGFYWIESTTAWANTPVAGHSYKIFHLQGPAYTGNGYAMQLAQSWIPGATLFVRSRDLDQSTNGGWGGWTAAYTRNNVVGAVCQSAGAVTGAIIERGSNANGEYVRYADGTQECWQILTLAYNSAADMVATWTYPAAFSVMPVATLLPTTSWNVAVRGWYLYSRIQGETVSGLTAVCSNAQSTNVAGDTLIAHVSARGRWF